ncbi:sensor histidine kinase [Agromyces sp. Leaf222]|uniref:sensor histidine kinase n=1 Tax=Agromyces sp. Leaf222 TaxID=1735688 RepID=UPI0006FC062A|nr:ATP-binding protein [Agromyces sp. Leaf222]KQM82760.1 hypothetical protein ASE68_05370 [Agromyces sp. Leaf222]
MTLGLPGDVSRDSVSRAIVHAGHVGAWVYLGMGTVVASALAIGGAPKGWIAAGLLLLMAGALCFVALHRTVFSSVLYLVVGGAVTVTTTVLAMQSTHELDTTDNAVVAIPCIALLLIGGAGAGSWLASFWVVAAYVVGQTATYIGAELSGAEYRVSAGATALAVFIIIVRTVDGLTRRAGLRRQAALVRANVAAREATARRDHELEAITRLHDTAMEHLLAIAAAGSGPIDDRLRAGIRQDLSLLVGRDWIAQHSGESGESAVASGVADGAPILDQAFAVAEDVELDVQMTGDLAVLGLLGSHRAAELDIAVAECLRNVAQHAGVREAEIILGNGGGEVTVAVMDIGSGFEPERVPPALRGLRVGVVERLEREGGSARVWSAIGLGTTIVLTMPEGGA